MSLIPPNPQFRPDQKAIESLLTRLKELKENYPSWQALADAIPVTKRTLMRWRKDKKMSYAYYMIVVNYLTESEIRRIHRHNKFKRKILSIFSSKKLN